MTNNPVGNWLAQDAGPRRNQGRRLTGVELILNPKKPGRTVKNLPKERKQTNRDTIPLTKRIGGVREWRAFKKEEI